MGEARPPGRSDVGDRRDDRQTDQIDIAQAARGQAGHVPAGDDEGDGRRDADQQAEQGRRPDRTMDRKVEQGHGGDAQRAAADAHHAGEAADGERQQLPARPAGDGLGDMPALQRQQHLDRHQQSDDAEHGRQNIPRDPRGDQHPGDGAQEDGDAPALQLGHVHRALGVVRPRRGDGCRDDRGQRGRHRHMHPHRGINAHPRQHQVQHRDDDDAAADAEQPGQKAAHGAGQQHHRRQRQQVLVDDVVHPAPPESQS
ncbi:hypothetical protein D3C87_1472980 [compost metagenome]